MGNSLNKQNMFHIKEENTREDDIICRINVSTLLK